MAKHHYLACCYLKGFAPHEYPDAIWQYQKSTGVLRMRGIGNVANRPNYYSRVSASGDVDDYAERFFGLIESEWPGLKKDKAGAAGGDRLAGRPGVRYR